MSRERLIRSLPPHSLAWHETYESSIDRIAAIGLASRYNEMGEAMLRVDALDAKALNKVILLVVRRLSHRHLITLGFAKKIAFATLHEYMRPNCIYCGGKGEEHKKGQVIVACPVCDGSGLHRYSDKDRKSLVGCGFNTKVYEDALAYVREAVQTIVISTHKRLD